jgi:hypothetical protein
MDHVETLEEQDFYNEEFREDGPTPEDIDELLAFLAEADEAAWIASEGEPPF